MLKRKDIISYEIDNCIEGGESVIIANLTNNKFVDIGTINIESGRVRLNSTYRDRNTGEIKEIAEEVHDDPRLTTEIKDYKNMNNIGNNLSLRDMIEPHVSEDGFVIHIHSAEDGEWIESYVYEPLYCGIYVGESFVFDPNEEDALVTFPDQDTPKEEIVDALYNVIRNRIGENVVIRRN